MADENKKYQNSADAVTALKKQFTTALRQNEELRERQSKKTAARDDVIEAIQPLEQQLKTFNEKAEKLGFRLDMTDATRQSELASLQSTQSELSARIRGIEKESEALGDAVVVAKRLLADNKANMEATEKERLQIETESAEYAAQASAVFGTGEFSADRIAVERADETDRRDSLEGLTRRTITLERALDASQRSAAIADWDASVRKLTTDQEQTVDQIEKLKVATSWFVQLEDILNDKNAEAVSNHVQAFGPLTTVIQRRLRPVFGFGDVSMTAKNKAIYVEVERDGEKIKPTDYFSDSQKQILMLSIFFASRLTQTWSGFSPILLDDPVTHFDDLNAFSFVELLRGLISNAPGERQFIISTCETRLFELMQKKFDGLAGGALFYQFDGINANGPVITQLES